MHDAGYAEVLASDLAKEPLVTLKPWARVEGVLRRGGAVLPRTEVDLQLCARGPQSPRVSQSYRTTTDGDGRFAFERVAYGSGEIGPRLAVLKRSLLEQWLPVTVLPGQTTRVTVGGTGRPVIGRVVPPEGVEVAYGSETTVELRKKAPTRPQDIEDAEREVRHQWWDEWAQTDAGRAWNALPITSFAVLTSDGSFRFEDVPAGEWQLVITLLAPRPPGQDTGRAAARLMHTLVVPEMPTGRSDEPLDVGTLTAERIVPPLQVGDAAPDFELTALDGRTVRLADLRGKFVLLDFWATWCGPCVQEFPHLQAIHAEFAAEPRLVMLGLSLDRKVEHLRKYLGEHPVAWPQMFLEGGFKSDVMHTYRIDAIPAIMLIGPDGKLVRTNLHGRTMIDEVRAALPARE